MTLCMCDHNVTNLWIRFKRVLVSRSNTRTSPRLTPTPSSRRGLRMAQTLPRQEILGAVDQTMFAVEVQRRDGDEVIFSDIFSEISEYLQSQLAVVSSLQRRFDGSSAAIDRLNRI